MRQFKKIALLLPFTALVASAPTCYGQTTVTKVGTPVAPELAARAKALNNEGVADLKKIDNPTFAKKLTAADWQRVFDKFETALKMIPRYRRAQENLATAHNNYGLALNAENKKELAFTEFQHAVFLDANNPVCVKNVASSMEKIGKDPGSSSARVELGDSASAQKDYVSAVVQYRAALAMTGDTVAREKLTKATQAIMDGGDSLWKRVLQNSN